MKLPNKYGTVYRLSGNRRNPWIARKPVGINSVTGRTEYVTLGYYRTRADALQALAAYNQAPYDLTKTMTFGEVYKICLEKIKTDLRENTVLAYESAYRTYLYTLEKTPINQIKSMTIQEIISGCSSGHSKQNQIKSLCSRINKYALKNELISRSFCDMIEMGADNDHRVKTIFTPAERAHLWALSEKGNAPAKKVLILIYSGCRISEFLAIEKKDVHLNESFFRVVDSKTAAGIRKVPICALTYPFFEEFYNSADTFLFSARNLSKKQKYDYFSKHEWNPLIEEIGANHTIHETRHTCATLMKEANVDALCRKMILGHRSNDITDDVYTHLNVSRLVEEINKLSK